MGQFTPWERTPAESFALRTLSRADFEEFAEGQLRPWEMPKWRNDTVDEASITLAKHGYVVNGTFEQFQVTPRGALLKANTNKGVVYLKANTRREVKATALIGSFAPYLARKPIAINEEKKWMLMNNYGTPLEDKISVREFEKLSVALGRLQLESMNHIEELREAGVPQESCESLICRTKKMLNDEEVRRSLGSEGSFECGAEDGMAEVGEYNEALYNLIRSMYENGRYPISLVHDDIYEGNTIKDKDGSFLLFDWGMAKLDFPVRDIRPLAAGVDPKPPISSEVLHPYFKLWEEYASISELQKLTGLITSMISLDFMLKHFEYGKLCNYHPPLMKAEVQFLIRLLVFANEEMKVAGS